MAEQTLTDLMATLEQACAHLDACQQAERCARQDTTRAQNAVDAAIKAASEYLVKNQPTVAQEIAKAVRR